MRLSPPTAFLASSLTALLLGTGCDQSDEGAPFCATPCVLEFMRAARQCAEIDGVDCAGPDCFKNGARTYVVSSELRDPSGELCLKRWGTASGLAWQTRDRRLRLDSGEGQVTCPDGSKIRVADNDSNACDPIYEPGGRCNSGFCESEAPDICPDEGCLCRESSCAAAFFDSVRECAGLEGEVACILDDETGDACYSNGARVTGTEEFRRLYAPDETLCLEVSVGPLSFPWRSYTTRNAQTLSIDESGEIVRCPDGKEEPGCGSAARIAFDDGCDPSSVVVTGQLPEFGGSGCCEPGVCGP